MNILDSLQEWVLQYEIYAFWMIVLFGIVHPLTENPWSFFTLSLALTILGLPFGYIAILIGTVIGILLLYVIVHYLHKKSGYTLQEKPVTKSILQWVKETASWRHMLVIGMPTVPTYPIKVAMPLSRMTFSRYMITLIGSYIFLYLANSLLYFGILSVITTAIPSWLTIVLISSLVLLIYFGKPIRARLSSTIKKEVQQ